ncbi:MAG TPA: type 1 glutamine amidotransferase [Candidatus Methanoperedens sp.]
MIIDARKGLPQDAKTWSSSNNVVGVILGGSRASVNDRDAWIAEELKFAGKIIDLYLPILGICFGHQILGKLFGADIERKAMKSGLIEIEPTKDDALFSGLINFRMPASHREQLSRLPDGFELLATSGYCKVQAMKLKDGNVYGVQFHPCYDEDVKEVRELGINDSNYGEHDGERVLRNFFRIAGI